MLEHSSRTITRMTRSTALPLLCLHALTHFAAAQSVLTFAGNAQHTAIYQPAARNLNRILWSTSIDLNNTGAYAHYGAPLISVSNTVVVPVKTAANGFQINVFNGSDGAAKYSLTTDYILPSYTWIPVYQPVLATIATRPAAVLSRSGRNGVLHRQSRFEQPRRPDSTGVLRPAELPGQCLGL